MLVARVWEWHVSTEVCSNISNTFLIIFRSFLFCCCGQTWSAQACVSHATYRRSCSRKWVLMNEFLIWNFSYNFIIIIICFLIAKNKRNLQINQENNILILQKIAPKEKLMKKFQGNGVGWDPDNGALNQTDRCGGWTIDILTIEFATLWWAPIPAK